MIKLRYDQEGKILGAYDSGINVSGPFIEVSDQAWSDSQAPFMVVSVDVPTLQIIVTEVHDYAKEFDPEKAIAREAQVFSAMDLIRLMPYSYTLNTLIQFKNFFGGVTDGVSYPGLKQVAQGLLSAGMILQSDYDKLAGILLEQGIDLAGGN